MKRLRYVAPAMPFLVACLESPPAPPLPLELPALHLDAGMSWNVPDSLVIVAAGLLSDSAVAARTMDGLLVTFGPLHQRVFALPDTSWRLVTNSASDGGPTLVAWPARGSFQVVTADGLLTADVTECEPLNGMQWGAAFSDRLTAVTAVGRVVELRHVLIAHSECDLLSSVTVDFPHDGLDVVMPSINRVVGGSGVTPGRFLDVRWQDSVLLSEARDSSPPLMNDHWGREESRWRGLPLLATDRGFLRILTDVTREERLFEFRDEALSRVRVSRLSAPIGFAASRPDGHRVLALHGRQSTILTIYAWAWGDALAETIR